jgi:[NiFe] hydrogenase assembly HybE family chaperone
MTPPEAANGLVTAFERIAATRMAGLPMNNPALKVAAIGFRPWLEGHHVGVLITPWAINLVVVSNAVGRDLYLASDQRQTREFPSGSYDFMGGDEPECGAFQFCSLFSPAFEFPDLASAEAMAVDILAALFTEAETAEDPREIARLAGTSPLRAPSSRRRFLQGMLGGLNR